MAFGVGIAAWQVKHPHLIPLASENCVVMREIPWMSSRAPAKDLLLSSRYWGKMPKKESAVVVLGTGEGFDDFRGGVEAQSGHVRQIFAVDVNFHGIAIGDVVHLVDVIVGRD